MVLKLRTSSSRRRSRNRPFDRNELTIVESLLDSVWPWWRNRRRGVNIGFRCRCSIGFWHICRCRLHICVSHDNVIGFIGVGGGSLKIFNLHLTSWRVWHLHVHFWNCFFDNGGSWDTFFFLSFIG